MILISFIACAGEEEEAGTVYSLNQTHDEVRRGMRLVIGYDNDANAFVGKVSNTTDKTIGCVRVEVHLSNGTELGPTPRMDLAADASRTIRLDAGKESGFNGWSTHPESGCGESGEHGGEGGESDEGEGERGDGERKGGERGGEHDG